MDLVLEKALSPFSCGLFYRRIPMTDNSVVPGMKLLSVEFSAEKSLRITLRFQGENRTVNVNNYFDNTERTIIEETCRLLNSCVGHQVVFWEFDPHWQIASYCFDSGAYGRFGNIESFRSLGLQ
jgi:hypothetical protein